MIKHLIKKIIGLNGDREKMVGTLKESIMSGKDKDIKQLQNINKRVKLLLDQGSIEIIIRDVNGILSEHKKKK